MPKVKSKKIALTVIFRFGLLVAVLALNFSCASRSVVINKSALITKNHFKISFNPNYKMANWVEYTLLAENLYKIASRRNKFFDDDDLAKVGFQSMSVNALAGTDYDRGHLAPSADFTYSQEANDSTFVMSNIVPQHKNLNRKAWRKLEQRVRGWACTEKSVTIITGVLFDSNMRPLPTGIVIPNQFFKIILDNSPPRKSIGFIYNQSDNEDVYKERVTKIKTILDRVNFDMLNEGRDFNKNFPESNLSDWTESTCS